ncbi:MAG: hypothetical protein A2043_11920 [Candidatus Schekmanbacteria bacterium GWA2_38_9]|nr:MAG: hypothetical protein A2043_11920 [Candidatus Schekmanbacteria bacterium GWA2_38_9]
MYEIVQDNGFLAFQNDVIRSAYEGLGQGYSTNDNEVALVTRLVASINGKSYKRLRLLANKIHGSRSYVEFDYRDKPTTKELGDMVIITSVTSGSQRLFQRFCIIQNKKASGDKWGIDREQLYLLKNFPPLSGNRGIMRGSHDIAFRNTSQCLGAFGLLFEPGEMIFASADLITEMSRGKNTLSRDSIAMPSRAETNTSSQSGIFSAFPWMHYHPKEMHFILRELAEYAGCFPWSFGGQQFIGNTIYANDICDLIRAWTQLNIGEVTCLDGTIVNHEVDDFTNHLIRNAGLGEGIDLPIHDDNIERRFGGQVTVFMMHLDVGKE